MTTTSEKIIAIKTSNGEHFYIIVDVQLNYYRSQSPITAYDAWTRDIERRARFTSYQRAYAEIAKIIKFRLARQPTLAQRRRCPMR